MEEVRRAGVALLFFRSLTPSALGFTVDSIGTFATVPRAISAKDSVSRNEGVAEFADALGCVSGSNRWTMEFHMFSCRRTQSEVVVRRILFVFVSVMNLFAGEQVPAQMSLHYKSMNVPIAAICWVPNTWIPTVQKDRFSCQNWQCGESPNLLLFHRRNRVSHSASTVTWTARGGNS